METGECKQTKYSGQYRMDTKKKFFEIGIQDFFQTKKLLQQQKKSYTFTVSIAQKM